MGGWRVTVHKEKLLPIEWDGWDQGSDSVFQWYDVHFSTPGALRAS